MSEGQGSLLNVMVVVILLGLFLTFLNYTRLQGRGQRSRTLALSTMAAESRDVLNGLYEIDYSIPLQENEELIIALRNGCIYGEREGRYKISGFVPVLYSPRDVMEPHLEERMRTNYFMNVSCTNNSMTFGNIPPANAQVIISNDMIVPDPRGGSLEVTLKRWIS